MRSAVPAGFALAGAVTPLHGWIAHEVNQPLAAVVTNANVC